MPELQRVGDPQQFFFSLYLRPAVDCRPALLWKSLLLKAGNGTQVLGHLEVAFTLSIGACTTSFCATHGGLRIQETEKARFALRSIKQLEAFRLSSERNRLHEDHVFPDFGLLSQRRLRHLERRAAKCASAESFDG